MNARLQARTALVTAAGQGIGRASAIAMAQNGATVWATDVNESLLEQLGRLQIPGLRTMRLDVLSESSVQAAMQQVDSLDVLFNCAGFVHHGTVLDIDAKAWELSFDLNVRAMVRTMQAWLPNMLERGSGSIINMASVASSIKGLPNRCLYGASKAAVIGLTKSVAADFITRGIRCNAICPGTVESPSLKQRIEILAQQTGKSVAQVTEDFVGRQPIGRLGRDEEVAALVVYLSSDESSFTTGTVHVIDGGVSL